MPIMDDRIEDQFRAIEGFATPGITAARRGMRPSWTSASAIMAENNLEDVDSVMSVAALMPLPANPIEPKQRDPRATRRGIVTYDNDDSPQQPDKPPTFPPAADVPFLPAPSSNMPYRDNLPSGWNIPQLVSLPMLEPDLTLSPGREQISARGTYSSASSVTSNAESRIRAKAGLLVGKEKGKEKNLASRSRFSGSRSRSPTSKHDSLQAHHVVLSPEQEHQSKRDVEDVLSRLEGHEPNYGNIRTRETNISFFSGENVPSDESVMPTTQFSARGSNRKTPITYFSSRGSRGAPATGFGSLYSPRHRDLQGKAPNKSYETPTRANGEINGAEVSSSIRSSVPITLFSSRRSATTPTLEPLDGEDNDDKDQLSLVGSVISVKATTAPVPAVAKRRELLHALSSDEDVETGGDTDTSPPPRIMPTREMSWEKASDDHYHGVPCVLCAYLFVCLSIHLSVCLFVCVCVHAHTDTHVSYI